MQKDAVQILLSDVKRLLDAAREDYSNGRLDNHQYYVSEFNLQHRKAKELGIESGLSEVKDAERDQEIPISWVEGTPYDPPMVESHGSKTRKLREVINSADKLSEVISSAMTSKQSKKAKAKELLQKSIDAIPRLEQQSAESDQFTKWRRDTEVAIEHIFSANSRHIGDFSSISYWPPPTLFAAVGPRRQAPRQKDPRPYYQGGLGEARVVLQSMIDEIETHWEEEEATDREAPAGRTPGEMIELICNRFHTVARQLKKRGRGKPAVEIADEYDVQYLMRALLYLFFEDVRPEEWTPSYAGKSSRVDFLLKVEKTVLEIKHARQTLTEKELGDELIIDIRRYQETHPDCRSLYCFVYDPEGYIDNPRGMENDLSKVTEGMPVKVIIAPKTH